MITSTGQQVLELSGNGLPSGLRLSPAGDSEIIPVGVNQVFLTNGIHQQIGAPTRPVCTVNPPTAPRTLTASPTNVSGQVKLTWSAPASDGGAQVTDYVIQRSANGTSGWATVGDGVSTATTSMVTGLTNGTRYYFRVLAKNAAGNSAWSNIANNIPRTVPSEPRTLTATPTNVSGQIRLSWLLPAVTGGTPVTDYIVQRSPNGTTGWATITEGVSTATSYTVNALTNGTRYYFRVLAKNLAGNSPVSNTANNIPRTMPSAPRTLAATPTNLSGQIRLAWLAPASNGGSAVTDYIIQRSPNGTSGWVTIIDGVRGTTGYVVPGLTNGTRYDFRVLAHNAAGNSASSNIAINIPRTVPSAPRSLTATTGPGRVTLRWIAPASSGGAAITDYVIQRSPNGTTAWVTINDGVRATTGYVVTGLTNGTRYYFRVLAKNTAGTGPSSNVVNAIPRTVPSAPRTLTATPNNMSGQMRLTWLAPASNGFSAVTDYIVQRSPNGSSGWVTVNDGVQATTGYTVTGLVNGTRYYFRVLAHNAAGNGLSSNVVNQIPRTVPGAPRLRAYPGTARVALTWTPPTSTGGTPITRYAVHRSTSPTTGWVYLTTTAAPTSRSFNAMGLRNGVRYYFRIVAINGAGVGAWSAYVSAVPTATAGSGYYFADCNDVRRAGAAPLRRGQAGFRTALDVDLGRLDGIACEVDSPCPAGSDFITFEDNNANDVFDAGDTPTCGPIVA